MKFINYNEEVLAINCKCIQLQQKGPLAYEYNPLKVFRISQEQENLPKYSLADLDTDKLEFDLNHPVNILPQESYDGSVNLILNDGKHYPKLINTRFSAVGLNKYQIVDREGDNDTNIYDEDSFEIKSSLYKKVTNIVKLDFIGITGGGNLKCGNYHFYFKLADEDGNETDFVAESGLVTCHIGNINDPQSIRGGIEDENSYKCVNFVMTNIDSAYNYVVVYYTRDSGSQDGTPTTTAFKIARKFQVTNKVAKILITGFDTELDVSVDEVNMQYEIVDNAYAQVTCQNMLFLGNVQKPEIPYKDLQDLSLRIYPNLTTADIGRCDQNYTDLSGGFEYYNVLNIYNKLGYWNDEIYRFGVVYIFNNGTLSPVFNVLGVPKLTATVKDGQLINSVTPDYPAMYKNNTRQYLSIDKDNYQLVFNDNTYNSKGVTKINYVGNQFDKQSKALGIKFNFCPSVTNELKKLGVKGLFFVRQKRIPTIFCQAVSVGLDKSAKVPLLKYTKNFYLGESFINKDRDLTHNFDERIYDVQDCLEGKAAICPEYTLRQSYFNQFFTVSKFVVQEAPMQFTQDYFTRGGRHLYNVTYEGNSNIQEYECTITAVADGIMGIKGKDQQFKAMAGEAASASKLSYLGAVNKNKGATNIIRGLFSPYIGLEGNQKLGTTLLNIRIPNYDETADYFSIRYRDMSPFYSITDRIDLDDLNSLSDSNEYVDAFRGDCFICNYSQRILRNFQDPETPINDTIVQNDTWKKHYSIVKNDSNESNTKINRADVNAVQLGHWVTFKVCSNINISMRCSDPFYATEQGLTGNNRSFYPLSSMDISGSAKIPESGLINGGYNVTTSYKNFSEMPDVPAIKNVFNTRIMYSNIQINDAYRNNYRVFKTMDYRDYPITYGSLTKLVEWGGSLVAVFEHGVAIIAVNERAVAANGAGGNVFITANNVLPQNPYIVSAQFGSQWPESIVKTPYGLYGIDTVAKKFWKITYGVKTGFNLVTISDFKIQRFLNENITLKEHETTPIIGIRNVKTHYNAFKGDVMFTFYDDLDTINEKAWNICYNEILSKFITFYSWIPSFSTNIDNIFFSFDRNDSKTIAKWQCDESFITHTEKQTDKGIQVTLKPAVELLGATIEYSILDSPYQSLEPINGVFTIPESSSNIYTIPIKMTATYQKYVGDGQSAVTIDTYYNNIVVCGGMPSNETYFWKHGQAGLMETAEDIKPCMWYGKQHPFEFEVTMNDLPIAHKIFSALQILSNKAEPESLHFEISGEVYNFADDKLNMFFRQEAYKHLQQYSYFSNKDSSDRGLIAYDDRYLKLKPELRPNLTNPEVNQRSTYFPLFYKRIDRVDEIEDYYQGATASHKDYQKLSGSEIVYDKLSNQFNIVTHMKASPYSNVIQETSRINGRLNGNMDYLEDKWLIQIPSINYRQKNENDWITSDKGTYPKIVLSQLWPDESIELGEIPPQLKELYGNDKEITDIISTEDWKYAAETRLRDKFIKIKIRYKGDQLAFIQALKTLYIISYA